MVLAGKLHIVHMDGRARAAACGERYVDRRRVERGEVSTSCKCSSEVICASTLYKWTVLW
jgi:hypothetical protein